MRGRGCYHSLSGGTGLRGKRHGQQALWLRSASLQTRGRRYCRCWSYHLAWADPLQMVGSLGGTTPPDADAYTLFPGRKTDAVICTAPRRCGLSSTIVGGRARAPRRWGRAPATSASAHADHGTGGERHLGWWCATGATSCQDAKAAGLDRPALNV